MERTPLEFHGNNFRGNCVWWEDFLVPNKDRKHCLHSLRMGCPKKIPRDRSLLSGQKALTQSYNSLLILNTFNTLIQTTFIRTDQELTCWKHLLWNINWPTQSSKTNITVEVADCYFKHCTQLKLHSSVFGHLRAGKKYKNTPLWVMFLAT